MSLTLHCLLLSSNEAAANSTLFIDFETGELAHVIIEMRQATRSLERDPRGHFVARPLYQKRVVLGWKSPDVSGWQRSWFDIVVASLQPMSHNAVDGKFESVGFGNLFQPFD